MKLKVILAILASKLTRFALRLLRRGGTALPGKVALKICPSLLSVLAKNVNVIAVTGTNGKTTSSRIVEQALQHAGVNWFSNRSGSNLIQGITADFAANAGLSGKMKKDWAVIECDEAASKQVFRQMRPRVILVTNVFRDQLDRYGEIANTIESIRIGLQGAPNATVCLNADCSLTTSLADGLPNQVLYFGVDAEVYKTRVRELSDAPRCLRCGAEYEYTHVTYGHLGAWRCPECGAARPVTQLTVKDVLAQTADGSKVLVDLNGSEFECYVNLPGGYNIYNAAGSIAAVTAAGFPAETAALACSDFNCGFGRMEKFQLGNAQARMILIKNTAGCNQVLNFLCNLDGDALFAVCLNDQIADGTDVSWIWDADFEKLLEIDHRLSGVLLAGSRAWDMAVRLKYAGVPAEKIIVCADYGELLQHITQQDKPTFIMPSYTAMLELRDRISREFGYGDFWE